MDEYARSRAAFRMRGAEPAEAAHVAVPVHCRRLRHEPVGSALAVLFRKIAADQHDLAGECLGDGGGPSIEAAQHIDEAVGRDRFEGRGWSEQYWVRHGWSLRPA